MKRAFFLPVTTAAVAAVLAAAAPATRACQYCRQAYEDPDAGRLATDNRGGSFPLDGSLGPYQAAPPPPPPAELKTAPAPGSVATNAGDLAAANTPPRRPAPPEPVPAAKAPVAAAASKTPSSDPAVRKSVAYWSDACLLGLAAAGGVFCWRTRRQPTAASRPAH